MSLVHTDSFRQTPICAHSTQRVLISSLSTRLLGVRDRYHTRFLLENSAKGPLGYRWFIRQFASAVCIVVECCHSSSRIQTVITDNAGRSVNAFRLAFVQILFNVINTLRNCRQHLHQEYQDQALNHEDENYVTDVEDDASFTWDIRPCFSQHFRRAHTLSLCTTIDCIAAMYERCDTLLLINNNVMSKCYALRKCAARNKFAKIMQNTLTYTLNRPGIARWNFLCDLVANNF